MVAILSMAFPFLRSPKNTDGQVNAAPSCLGNTVAAHSEIVSGVSGRRLTVLHCIALNIRTWESGSVKATEAVAEFIARRDLREAFGFK